MNRNIWIYECANALMINDHSLHDFGALQEAKECAQVQEDIYGEDPNDWDEPEMAASFWTTNEYA